MTNLGIPVPPGFTITTEVCDAYYKNGKKYPSGLEGEVAENLNKLEIPDPDFSPAAFPFERGNGVWLFRPRRWFASCARKVVSPADPSLSPWSFPRKECR